MEPGAARTASQSLRHSKWKDTFVNDSSASAAAPAAHMSPFLTIANCSLENQNAYVPSQHGEGSLDS